MREEERAKLQRLKHEHEGKGGLPRIGPVDPVDRLLNELREVFGSFRITFTSSFLNDVGNVFERDGFGAAKAYLMGRGERREEEQAQFLLNEVLPRLQSCPAVVARRALGRYVIKILDVLQRRGPRDSRASVSDRGGSPGADPGRRRP